MKKQKKKMLRNFYTIMKRVNSEVSQLIKYFICSNENDKTCSYNKVNFKLNYKQVVKNKEDSTN